MSQLLGSLEPGDVVPVHDDLLVVVDNVLTAECVELSLRSSTSNTVRTVTRSASESVAALVEELAS